MQKILIIDDDRAVCSAIGFLLKKSGFETMALHRPNDVLEMIDQFQPDLIILDMNFSIDTTGRQGLKLLREIRAQQISLPIILMTGWATLQLAVEGMKAGAKDFLAKPWDNKQLLSSIKTILQIHGKKSKPAESGPTDFDHIIGKNEEFLAILDRAKTVARTDASVFITGESGTGKEVVAEAIHYNSMRSNQPFVKVNLGGISTSLFESEMFGHKKGAFTDAHNDRKGRFETANTGTIFLDEIGDLNLASQVKLLRVLQEKTFEPLGSSSSIKTDVRVISATNKDLEEMVAKDQFREDLYYRINLITIHLPPLRDRSDDIPLLANYFLDNIKSLYRLPDLEIHKRATDWLEKQSFPGNIRQLKNLVERTALLSIDKKVLDEKAFQANFKEPNLKHKTVNLPDVGVLSLQDLEVKMIEKTLIYHNQNISKTARSLGITRSALYRRLAKHNIPYEPEI